MATKDDTSCMNALRALAAAGAPDALIGLVARELMGHKAVTPARETATPAGELPENNGPKPTHAERSTATAAPPRKPAPPEPPIVMYRKPDGARSSVSVKPVLWASLLKVAAESDLKAKVQSLAESAPAGQKTSVWVADELTRLFLS
ncbi:hypothetical protein [Burkholderia cenocepacia]|uniref:hypothetical protein n=1 Tax=Burkholderia cenocepacia TaxID=95486 RepID=UPI000760D17B|nr:hypothetical protein [Burkholderia cenocepacia]KWU23344.1 hypothetical protein AS149_37360 [Burkholderia cenocepacia]